MKTFRMIVCTVFHTGMISIVCLYTCAAQVIGPGVIFFFYSLTAERGTLYSMEKKLLNEKCSLYLRSNHT